MGSRFSGLGSFWVFFEVSWEPLLKPGGTRLDLSWLTWRLLGCLGWPLESLGDQFGFQLGDFLLSWEPCDANLGISWVALFPSGSGLASFGYLLCEWSFLSHLWRPLVEFVDIGESGLDLG